MSSLSRGVAFAARLNLRLPTIASAALMICNSWAFSTEEKKHSPCTEDAMIVFDASRLHVRQPNPRHP